MVRQYGTITITKYQNADFELSTDIADIIQIKKINLDSDVDNVLFSLSQPTATKNTGAGTKLKHSTPGGEAKAELNVYEDSDRTIYNFLNTVAYPESSLNGQGRIEHYTPAGIDYTDYRNVVRFDFVPIDASENPNPARRVIIERAAVMLEESDKMGQHNVLKVTFDGQGGERKAELVSVADLSGGVDLSTGATDKLVKMTMAGLVRTVNFLQANPTNQAAIVSAINTAFGQTLASVEGNFIKLKSTVFAAPIILEDPDTGSSGLNAIFGFTERTLVKGTVPLIEK